MQAVIEVFVALLAVWGLVSLGWLVLGRLVMPQEPGEWLSVLAAQGDGETLEQSVRGLIWLRCAGVATGTIVILDRGLSPEGKRLAQALCQKEGGVVLREEL